MGKLYRFLSSCSVLSLFLQVVPITLSAGAVYGVFRWAYVRKKKISVGKGREIMRLLFVCYLTGLINLTLTPRNLWINIWAFICTGHGGSRIELFGGSFNLIPVIFKIISGEMTAGSWVRTMLTGNLLMFVPMGFFLPFVSEKISGKNILKTAAIIPAAVEIVQPAVGRSFDADDLILNFAGIVIGFAFSAAVKAILKGRNP